VQRYACTKCGKKVSELQPLDGVRIEAAKAAQVVNMLAEGVGIRAASRLTGLDQSTIINVLRTAGEHCARLLETKCQNLTVGHVEIDEVFAFVKTLQANTDKDDQEHGDQYAYFATDQQTKLILHWHVGKRDTYTSREFLETLKPKLAGRFQLTSDGFN